MSHENQTPTQVIADYLKLQEETTLVHLGEEYEKSELYRQRRENDEKETWWGGGYVKNSDDD